MEDLTDHSKSLGPAFLSTWFIQLNSQLFLYKKPDFFFFIFFFFFNFFFIFHCGTFQWSACYALLTQIRTLTVICPVCSLWVRCPDLLALSHLVFTGIFLLLSDKADQIRIPETCYFFFFFFPVWFGACNKSTWEHLQHCCVCMKNTTSRPHELENKFQKGIFALRAFPKDTETN